MRSSIFFTSTILGLFPSCLLAMAIRGRSTNLNIGPMGFVDERNNTKHAKRGKGYFPPPPDGCWVTGLGESSYWYIPVYSGDDVYACMMGHKGATGQLWNCPGDEWWPDSYVDEIIAAGQEQTTKDGSGEQSEKGVFTAQWEGQTTAVSDREGMAATLDALFRYSLPSSGAIVKARHYYYNFKGEHMGIVHKDSDCRGFLGLGGDRYEYCPGHGHCKDD